jgi:RNA polymerase sigma-70 factor (ECF subfamily)
MVLAKGIRLAGNDERGWLERARAGDVEAFGALVLAHQRFVYNLAWRALGDEHEAQDAAQEAFLRVWQALPNFRGQSQFRTWLYRIVTNVCYGRLPRLRRQFADLGDMEVEELPDETQPDPSARVEAAEQRAFLWQQIEALPASYRVLVLLRYQQGLSYDEIASVLSLPLGTVKTGLFRARARLRDALSAFEELPL